jgi:hypothetical protein
MRYREYLSFIGGISGSIGELSNTMIHYGSRPPTTLQSLSLASIALSMEQLVNQAVTINNNLEDIQDLLKRL